MSVSKRRSGRKVGKSNIGEIVQHLKGVHGSREKVADSSGKIMADARFAMPDILYNAYSVFSVFYFSQQSCVHSFISD